ncbi:MAG: glycosyltransferase family 4 protein [Candidatus Omnitrophica bacterium]|nr:glycosyltransferase family 4 protein [Candidatus Omnitrophota bacterium]
MKIGIDIRPFIFSKAGIHTYLSCLIPEMAKNSPHEFMLFTSSASRFDWKEIAPRLHERVWRFPHYSQAFERFWQEYILPRAVRSSSVDVFHGLRFFVPRGLICPAVLDIQDVGFKKFPAHVTPGAFNYFDKMVRDSIPRAQKIISPSVSTRQDIIEFYNVSPAQIAVIPEGVGREFFINPQEESLCVVREKFSLKRGFILFVGTVQPRKNVGGLLEAFKALSARFDIDLVIAGEWGWGYEEILEQAETKELKARVHFLQYVSAEELRCLYNLCEVFVLPSFYEGFGLPVSEAMACGTPTVVANNSSLKEFFSDASIMVEAHEPDSIADGIRRALSDSALRQELINKGLRKAESFSWEETARKTLAVYTEVAK